MQFISNRIINPIGKPASFQEYLDRLSKTASDAKKQEDDTSNNNINNDSEPGAHSYQEGESVSGKPDQAEGKGKGKTEKKEATANKTAKCGKEMGESGNAGKVTEKHTPASSTESGSESESGSTTEQFINNDPSYQKGESVTMKKKEDKKSAKANAKSSFKKVASLNRNEKLSLFATLGINKSNPIQYIEAMAGLKVANLTGEEKAWLKKFWSTQYPDAYVNEMLADR